MSELVLKRRSPLVKKTPLSEEVNRVITWLMGTLLALMVGAGAILLFNLSARAQEGYLLRQVQFQNDSLETENRLLKARVLEAQSFLHLQDSAVVQDMQRPL